MPHGKKKRVCPVAYAHLLDMRWRRWWQNPRRILGPYVKEGMTVLDVGCGPGFFTVDLARMVGAAGQVIAADLQEGMLRILREKIRGTEVEDRITLHRCEETRIGYSGQVDFILAFFMAHEVPDQAAFFDELHSILKPSGRIYLSEPPIRVSREEFEETLAVAQLAGFRIAERPKLRFSKAVVLQMR